MASLFVNKRRSGSWRIIEQVYDSTGKRIKRHVPVASYQALGIDPKWDITKARERIKQINAKNAIETQKVTAAKRRQLADRRVESAFLLPSDVDAFEQRLRDGSSSPEHEKKLLIQWKFAQRIIAEVKLEPDAYAENSPLIYKQFQKVATSLSYTEKVIFVLNQWGSFICRARKVYFEKIPYPSRVDRERILAAYHKKPGKRVASLPLTPDLLKKIKGKLPTGQWEWLFVSLWFGLRPEEMRVLYKGEFKCRIESQGATKVIRVYQPKLTSIPPERRWKPIPVIYKEQKLALSFIEENKIVEPLNKTVKAATGQQTTKYAGRKGFTDLMLSLGQKLENISVWMGHTTIDRTWRHYKDKSIVAFDRPKRSA